MKNFVCSFSVSLCLGASIVITACGGGSSSGGTTTPPAAQPPVVASISPSKVNAGVANTTLTVTGSNFASGTVIQVGQTIEPTTFVSASQVTALLPASQLASGGTLSVIAENGSLSSASGTPVSLEVDNPAPAVTLLSPATATVGSAPANIAVSGTGFVPVTVVNVNGVARTTVFISATQVNFVPSAADLAATGSLAVTAVNAAPGGGTSTASTLSVNNPVVGTLQLTPSTVATGGSAPITITIKGNTFVPTSVVQVNGATRSSTFVDANTLTFALAVSEQASAAVFAVTVSNPAPGGGVSPAAGLTVAAPALTPVITSVNPSSILAGSPDTFISVFGTGFVPSSVVQWNGTPLVTTYFAGYYGVSLSAIVPAADLATQGTASVTVNTPTANPPLSNASSVTINNPPAPTLTSLSPGAVPINADATVTLSGSNFTAASTVSFNGSNLNITVQNTNSLTVTVPAASISVPGIYPFTVTTPAPGGGTSASLNLTAYAPIANNDMVYNPANGLFYVSVPSLAGPPYGNSVVSVNPATGALGNPIFVGSEPNRLAISSDGKILWVGLDGASAVREVDLTTGTAGLQFTLGNNAGIYASPETATALVALPGAPTSVVVSAGSTLAIFDSGVVRGTSTHGVISNSGASTLLADGTRSEIYAATYYGYATYTYDATGLTPLATANTGSYVNYGAAEMQIANGRLYTDLGYVYDAESGALLGTFYNSGTTVAGGTTVADVTLGTAFVFNSNQFTSISPQIQLFNITTFNRSASAIPVNYAVDSNVYNGQQGPSRLTRWGANGLAFRTSLGLFSLRSNIVKDLSSTSADLKVTVAATGSLTTGATTTFTATVKNNGPSTATGVAFTAQWPSTGVVASTTPSSGTCSVSSLISCDLGSIASGSSVTVAIAVQQQSSGNSTVSAQVVASENDPNPADNQASATATVTGSAYNPAPVISAISPAAILAGASDTVITVTGTGFSAASTVMLSGTGLATTLQSPTELTATVSAAQLATLGWSAVSVSNSAPGGGNSASLPLTVYSVLTLGVNHILYDPYSRNIMASVGSGSSSVTGNSIVAINPESGSIGTPVNIGSQPANIALTSDGQILYTVLLGSQSVARYNMLTQQADFTYQVPEVSSASGLQGLRGVATQPGTENTIALDLGSWAGDAIYDFDPVNKTAAIRGQATGPYTGSCIQFLDAADMYSFDVDTSGSTFNQFAVTSTGFQYYNYTFPRSTLLRFGCFKFSGGLAFANGGGVANPSTAPASQVGILSGPTGGGTFSSFYAFAPDASIGQAFYLTQIGYGSSPTGITAYNLANFMSSQSLPVDFTATEGVNSSSSPVDLVRWGQDGLALLSSGGHIYLFRGAFVLPQLLRSSTAATLTSSSVSSIAHGSGNLMLTLTGSNFLPGVAVTWNGAYRTTTIVDSTHVTVAIPTSDLGSAGTASLVAKNPGASASSALTFTIN